ncbi:MAG: tRNA 2-thiouridine(34) synthase MnmA, partial [Bacteroidetes bacterium]|nr:tRNA 2-thiouridine(34) synthase MnmA [Bacteroidota bacterium]
TWYVLSKNSKTNQLTLTNNYFYPGLFFTTAVIEMTNWINHAPQEGKTYTTKARYLQQYVECSVKKLNETEWEVTFAQPQRAVTSGQSLVLYDNGVVVGGGIIK